MTAFSGHRSGVIVNKWCFLAGRVQIVSDRGIKAQSCLLGLFSGTSDYTTCDDSMVQF